MQKLIKGGNIFGIIIACKESKYCNGWFCNNKPLTTEGRMKRQFTRDLNHKSCKNQVDDINHFFITFLSYNAYMVSIGKTR